MFCISSDTRWQLGPNKSVRMEKRAAAAAFPERKKNGTGRINLITASFLLSQHLKPNPCSRQG